ncbi:peptidoglycan-binding protein [Alkalibacter mobilis]|uniref:peptidoglycan-binding protein n=1 Tax=Alkalibacter mobilis TaxID=2787712 RepID=UPI00189F1F4E|nr:peptidoglycan-binding protein [Alkalibacter mobilis]MBF7097568.1 peptidoglycan-binding protein [Alkalibacter mobilis]
MGGKYLLYPQDGLVRVTSPFGIRNGSLHSGVDLASDNKGTDWNLAAADGAVTGIGHSSGAGYYIVVKVGFEINGKSAWIRYYHGKERARFYDRPGRPLILMGDKVMQGEKIQIEGNTGNSRGSHLHFELRLGADAKANAVNPVPYLWIPKALPIDKGTLTQSQFKNVNYVEDFTEGVKELKRGDKGSSVKAIQKALINIGYNMGKYGVDGSFGPVTENVVKKFQSDQKLSQSGIVDDQTLERLIDSVISKSGLDLGKLSKSKELAKQIIAL